MAYPIKKIFIASDHAGFARKQALVQKFSELPWVDLGPSDETSIDYPDQADQVCQKVSTGEGIGVLICGSGQGMAMRANKYPQIRAALVWSVESTHLSREHNDANVLCFGARLLDESLSFQILQEFLNTEFAGGRHCTRVNKTSAPLKA